MCLTAGMWGLRNIGFTINLTSIVYQRAVNAIEKNSVYMGIRNAKVG